MLQPVPLPPLEYRPLVSVLIANYNYGHLIAETIQSVLSQTYANFEVIVCDDGSTDDSVKVINSFAQMDSRIKLNRLSENRGMAAATNAAFAHSSGEILCLLDSDDCFEPEKIERIVDAFRTELSTGLIVHPLLVIQGNDGKPVQQIPFLTRFEYGWIADRLIERGGRWRDMPTSALCLRREVAELVFPVPESDFRRAADGYIFTLTPLLTEVSAIEEPLARYRIHRSNDHAVLGMETRTVESDERFIRLQNQAVNARVEDLLGISGCFDLERHLDYQQKTLLLRLLRGESRRQLFPRYLEVMRMLRLDDLYSRKQRLLGILVYGLAIPLPQPVRQRWLAAVLGYNPLKRWIQRKLKIMHSSD